MYCEDEEDEPRECHLLEVLPGLYVTSLHFYQNDHVNYRIEAGGEPVENKKDIHQTSRDETYSVKQKINQTGLIAI